MFNWTATQIQWCFNRTWVNICSQIHYHDVIMGVMASQTTSSTIVYSTVYSGANHQSSESLTFVRGIHRWHVKSPHKAPVTRKMFPFDDVIKRPLLCINSDMAELNTTQKLIFYCHHYASIDKWLHPLLSVKWNYLSIPKIQRHNSWTLGQVLSSQTLHGTWLLI